MTKKLNVRIATEVLGLTLEGSDDYQWIKGSRWPSMGDPPPIPSYSTEISEAWEVVNHLPGQFELYRTKDNQWQCLLHPGSSVVADTAPMAICLAALKAVGIEHATRDPGERPPEGLEWVPHD